MTGVQTCALPIYGIRAAPTALTVFRIGDDGKLTFARKYDMESGGKLQWWAGMMGLPA